MAQPAIRAAQLADAIRDTIAGWLHADYPGSILTVSDVTLTPDNRTATVWILALTDRDRSALKRISRDGARYTHRLRHALTRRNVPELTFREDMPETERAALLSGE